MNNNSFINERDCPNRKALFKHIFETISNEEYLEIYRYFVRGEGVDYDP